MVYFIEFIIMILLAVLYFNFILPYCLQNLLDNMSNDLPTNNFTKNINNYYNVNDYINSSYLDDNSIVISNINYTNNNIYIYK